MLCICAHTCSSSHIPSVTLPYDLQVVRDKYGDDWARINRMSIIEEVGGEK